MTTLWSNCYIINNFLFEKVVLNFHIKMFVNQAIKTQSINNFFFYQYFNMEEECELTLVCAFVATTSGEESVHRKSKSATYMYKYEQHTP